MMYPLPTRTTLNYWISRFRYCVKFLFLFLRENSENNTAAAKVTLFIVY